MDKRYNNLLLVLIVSLLLVVFWVLGKRQGAQEATAIAATQLSSTEAQSIIEQLQTSLSETRLELERTQMGFETATARAQATQRMLDEQLRESVADSRDLALYRRIENNDSNESTRELVVESLVWSPTQPSILNLTLIQWQGRDRVSGQLQVSLNMGQIPASSTDSIVDEAESSLGDDRLTLDLNPVEFDLRFFQRINVQLPSELGDPGSGKSTYQPPDSVTVRIIPTDSRLRARDTLILWTDIEQ